MTTFTMRHEIDCTPERFWELFFDEPLQKKIFAALEYPKWEVIEQKDTDKEIVRIVKAIPKLDAPAAVSKVLGSGFGYVEEGRFDKSTKLYRFAIKPTTLAEKLKTEGTVKVEAKGADKCTRIVDIVAEAKIFGISGILEKVTEKSLRDGWQKGADMFNARLKDG
jgi:hypothetical protein